MTNLTPEEINRVLAEWMGWTEVGMVRGELRGAVPGETRFYPQARCTLEPIPARVTTQVPNFTKSLDKISTIEAKLTDEQWELYCDQLMWDEGDDGPTVHRACRVGCSTPALQKATALVRALGLGGAQ